MCRLLALVVVGISCIALLGLIIALLQRRVRRSAVRVLVTLPKLEVAAQKVGGRWLNTEEVLGAKPHGSLDHIGPHLLAPLPPLVRRDGAIPIEIEESRHLGSEMPRSPGQFLGAQVPIVVFIQKGKPRRDHGLCPGSTAHHHPHNEYLESAAHRFLPHPSPASMVLINHLLDRSVDQRFDIRKSS